jgi:hypothetical protein
MERSLGTVGCTRGGAPTPTQGRSFAFIDCINRGDVEALGRPMSDDHSLYVFDELPVTGRTRNIEARHGYAASFPNYVIHPHRVWGAGHVDSGLVFCWEDGSPLHPQTVAWHLRRLAALAAVPTIRVHDLRHTHATSGHSGGRTPKGDRGATRPRVDAGHR